METLTIQEKLLRVQSELKAPKNQYNSFGKYKYRSQEDILEAVKPLLAKYDLNLIITDEVIELAELPVINATVKVFDSELRAEIQVSAQAGVDISKKGMDIAQTFGSSSSYARKYALNGMFLIDDTRDADSTNTHGATTSATATAPSSSAKQAKPILKKGTEEYNKVRSYIQQGGDIAQVRGKYQVTKTIEESLIS